MEKRPERGTLMPTVRLSSGSRGGKFNDSRSDLQLDHTRCSSTTTRQERSVYWRGAQFTELFQSSSTRIRRRLQCHPLARRLAWTSGTALIALYIMPRVLCLRDLGGTIATPLMQGNSWWSVNGMDPTPMFMAAPIVTQREITTEVWTTRPLLMPSFIEAIGRTGQCGTTKSR